MTGAREPTVAAARGAGASPRERAGALIALALLGLVVGTTLLTFTLLLFRGPPWSESGYHRPAALRHSPLARPVAGARNG